MSGCRGCNGERRMSNGRPFPVWQHRARARRPGLCWACASDADNADAREARRLARTDRTCECGETFTPTRSDGLYCSAACKQRAYRRRVSPSQ